MGQTGWYGLYSLLLFEISDFLSSFLSFFFFLSSDISKEVLHLIFSTVSLFLKMSQRIKNIGKIKNKNRKQKNQPNKSSLAVLDQIFHEKKTKL